ncbi:MAG TPA: ATP-binding protein [Puia sp.]|uniref:ATP-binding protein n=1 Tax=Puia sp. TaxID=2045100 RepID=UPI002CD80C93|nr:ATP-binding protein [Puia sp.]HVU94085.1 ATP-binding protein [Puia sp.]
MQRNLFQPLVTHLDKKEFSILTGARQTGKSTLLRQLEAHCKELSKPAVFLNLENRDILTVLDEHPFNLLNYLPKVEERVVVLLDEVQYLKDPSNFLKLLYDEQAGRVKIIATGSSAFYIDGHFKDSLAGRKRVFQLLTCSFDEYLRLSDKDSLLVELQRVLANKDARTTQIEYLRQEWDSFMIYGGYPAVITEPDRKEKIERLKEIRDSFVKRDILESGVQNETAFFHLFRLMADQSGCLVNAHELSTTLRIKSDTVSNYLRILQKCFHLALVKPFFRNLRKELTKMPKGFLLDTGLRNSLLNNFQSVSDRPDKGELWETACFRTLIDRWGLDSVYYWRTADGNEVDFVLPETESPIAIEAKYDETLIKTSKYKKFKEAYPAIPLHFVWAHPFNEDFFRRLDFAK